MNGDELKNRYLGLPDSEKIAFLALVSSQLTIHGRAFELDLSGEQQSKAFVGLNELQHKISNHIAGIAMERERYPEDVFWSVLVEKAAQYGLSVHLAQCFNSARGWTLGPIQNDPPLTG
jgi:hypothetical protein